MKNNNIPMRRCIGCMISKPQSQLIRIVLSDGELKVDKNGKLNGRGSYICKSEKCIDTAIKKRAFNRTYKRDFSQSLLDSISQELEAVKGELINDEK